MLDRFNRIRFAFLPRLSRLSRRNVSRALAAIVAFATLVALLGGCGQGEVASATGGAGVIVRSEDASTSPSGSLPCDVERVVRKRCQSCHGAEPQFGAPMPLVTFEDFHRATPSNASERVWQSVTRRVHDTQRPMPPRPNAALDEAELAIVDAWQRGGAPSGHEATCETSSGPTNTSGTLSCTPDSFLRPASRWPMPANMRDEYVCFGVDVTREQKTHVVGIAPHVDNARILHHVILLQSDQSFPNAPFACPSTTGTLGRMIYAWAPGGQALELPPVAGIPEEGTTHYLVQIHYNNAQALEHETDATGIDLCTTTTLRPNDADMMAFGTTTIDLPPHAARALDCRYTAPEWLDGIHLFAAMPHMHELGTHMKTFRAADAKRAATDLGTVDAWDFSNQVWQPLDETIHAGDVIRTTCAWQNSGGERVHFGENTSDEMCWSFTMYYPKVDRASWTWATPSFASRCDAREASR